MTFLEQIGIDPREGALEIKSLKAQLSKAIDAARAFQDLNIVYRTQGRPSNKLLDRCNKGREFLISLI